MRRRPFWPTSFSGWPAAHHHRDARLFRIGRRDSIATLHHTTIAFRVSWCGTGMICSCSSQNHNVLSDARRGWLAIDPKGVVGEVEYEIGTVFRNPVESPNLFTSSKTIESRLQRFVRTLGVHDERVLQWAFAQAVLSVIWAIE